MNENVIECAIEWLRGDKEATVTAYNASKLKNRVTKLAEEYPDVTLIEEVPNAEDVEVCQKLMDNVLIAAPEGNIDMIFASNSSSALGTIAAVESAARKDVIVIGIDDEEGQLNELKKADSCYYATVAQDPIAIGKYCVEAAVKVMNGEEVEDIAVPAKLLTKENIEEYIAENESAKAELDAYK